MLEELYNDRLISLAANIPLSGVLESADFAAQAHSKICGSRISITLNVKDHIITDYAQEVKACLLGQCAASIVGAHIIGCHKDELLQLKNQMEAMLKKDGDPPTGKWQDLELLLPVRAVKQRHSSVMLVFEAVVEALEGA